nr:MAG TPA: Protein of unknown function (DUF2634) [Caudoviricetes sp.]
MPFTLALNKNWDIYVNENGDIATIDNTYAIAQNAANAVRLFTNDAYFDTQRGIPHYDIELGNKAIPNRSTLTNRIKNAILEIENVDDVEVVLEFNNKTRTYGGNIYITTTDSTTIQIEL